MKPSDPLELLHSRFFVQMTSWTEQRFDERLFDMRGRGFDQQS